MGGGAFVRVSLVEVLAQALELLLGMFVEFGADGTRTCGHAAWEIVLHHKFNRLDLESIPATWAETFLRLVRMK